LPCSPESPLKLDWTVLVMLASLGALEQPAANPKIATSTIAVRWGRILAFMDITPNVRFVGLSLVV
jgi:hypothetical protein